MGHPAKFLLAQNNNVFFLLQQIPQQPDMNMQENIQAPQPIEVAGPSSTSSQTVTGN